MYINVGIFLHADEYYDPAVRGAALCAEKLFPEFCGYVFRYCLVIKKPYKVFMQKREYQIPDYAGWFWDAWNPLQLLCGGPSGAGRCLYAE